MGTNSGTNYSTYGGPPKCNRVLEVALFFGGGGGGGGGRGGGAAGILISANTMAPVKNNELTPIYT